MLSRTAFTATCLLLAAVWASPITTLQRRQQQEGRFSFYDLKTAASGPCDLAAGPDNALWGQSILVNHIFRLDPQSGEVSEYPIPFTTPISNATIPGLNDQIVQDRTTFSCAIRAGADGNLYAANGLHNQLVRINPTTKEIKVFQPPLNPLGNLQPFNDLYTAHNGIWFTQTTGNTFQFFAFATQTFTTYQVPTPLALPLGLYVDSQGIVYVAEMLGNKILTYNPNTTVLNEYPLPAPLQMPTVIRAERDGWVYFAMLTGNGIGRINQATHVIELYQTNQLGELGAEDTIDKYGGVWLSFFGTGNLLARLDTGTFKFDYVPFPDTFAAAGANGILGDLPPNVDVAVNYGPEDAVWFTSILRNQIGKYSLTGLYD